MELKDKIALVTGASRGIGREVAIELGKEGCEVLVVGRDVKLLESTKQKILKVGGKCEVFKTDLRDLDELIRLTETVKTKHSSLSILCNVAGIYHSDTKTYFDIPYEEFSNEAIVDSLEVGIMASMLLSRAFIPLMKKGGRIVNTSGTFGKGEKSGTFEKGCMADLVTKKAIEVFTKQLAYELEDKNITVNAVCPWFVWTENVQKFFPETKDEAIPVNKVAKVYISLIKSNKNGEVVEVRN
ncbi:SDR family oxidoreductase [Patescibacteria group bacterium]|nr:SDR family oxidoreductase [Patescibacteria group bacterium]